MRLPRSGKLSLLLTAVCLATCSVALGGQIALRQVGLASGTTNTATLPVIIQQPQSQTVTISPSVTFSVVATGTSPLSYQWQLNGNAIAYQTNSTLVLTNVLPSSSGNYSVVVSNPAGSVSSDAALLTVNIPAGPPLVVTQPQGTNILQATPLTLLVAVLSDTIVTYQWYKNGVMVTNATAPSLNFTNLTLSDGGVYTVAMTNTEGSVISTPAVVTVTPWQLVVGGANNTTRSVVLPVKLVTMGNPNWLSFSLGFNPAVLTNAQVALAVSAGDTNRIQFPAGQGLTNALQLSTDLSLSALGRLGVSVAAPAGGFFQTGTYEVVSIRFDVVAGRDISQAALTLTNSPVALQVKDSSTNTSPPLTTVEPATVLTPISTNLLSQSGLFTQLLTIINSGTSDLSGVRVRVSNLGLDSLTNQIQLYNLTGLSFDTGSTNTNGLPYLQYGALPAGASVQLTAEFYVSDRRTVPTPQYEVLPGAPIIPFVPANVIVTIDRYLFTNGVFLVEFNTISNRNYYVEYKDNLATTNWNIALPSLHGTGSRVQWVDDGPPKTQTPPSAITNRFYQIVLYP